MEQLIFRPTRIRNMIIYFLVCFAKGTWLKVWFYTAGFFAICEKFCFRQHFTKF